MSYWFLDPSESLISLFALLLLGNYPSIVSSLDRGSSINDMPHETVLKQVKNSKIGTQTGLKHIDFWNVYTTW